MRRSAMVATSLVALVAALVVGPFGAAAAPPYVYGCTPATFWFTTSDYYVSLSIYNGTSTTANLTRKILAANGAILNSTMVDAPALTTTVAPTKTAVSTWFTKAGNPAELATTVPASLRIVSDVPVVATYSHNLPFCDWKPLECLEERP
jgi:hypothetical protein